jgi:NAD(P)-dependent dehydrogenase (short-subunit alcohol dehydrogenase family)
MGKLSGKVAVITGSSRGLGYAIAEAYAREGAAVVLAARNVNTLNQAISALQQKGYSAAGIPCDISSHADLEALGEMAVKTFGHLDIWVNNAGVGASYGPTLDVTVSDFEGVLRTNVFGTYYGSVVAMRYFLKQGSGKLINLLGRGDTQPIPFQNAYASSKTWVRSFTLSLAKEYKGSGIGIYAFNPGLVLTDMLTHVVAAPGYTEAVKPLITVMHFWGQTAEIPAQKALWLASSATDGKTGLVVKVLSFKFLIFGVLRELHRRLWHLPDPIPTVTITENQAVK